MPSLAWPFALLTLVDEFDQKEMRSPKQHVHSSLSSWNLQAPKLSVRIAMAKQAVVATQPLSVLQLTHVGFCSQPLSDVMLQPETGNKRRNYCIVTAKAVFSFDWSWIPVPYAPLAHCRIAQVLMGHLQDRTCHHQWPWPTANQWLWCKFHLSQVRKLRKLCKLPHQATSCDCWTSISWRPGSCPHEQSSAYSVENKQ